MKIHLGSKSELKKAALLEAIEFIKINQLCNDVELLTFEVESGVPTTPNSSETYLGARNRANLMINNTADLYIGLESGLIEREVTKLEECWCVIVDNDKNQWIGVSSAIQLPMNIQTEMSRGKTHVETLIEIESVKRINRKDTWGIYSNGVIPRSVSLYEASRNALVSYFNQ